MKLRFCEKTQRLSLGAPWRAEQESSSPLLTQGVQRPLSVDLAIWPLAKESGPGAVLFAFVVVDEAYEYLEEVDPWGEKLPVEEEEGDEIEHGRLLGFDVADASQKSGLLGCPYHPHEREALSRRFGESLNEHHLFRDLTSAQRFKELANIRVKEMAPFYVFALYAGGDDG